MSGYKISKIAPSEAKPDLLRLWRDNMRGDVDRRFRWTYEDAPEIWNHVFVLAADQDSVGTAGIEVRPFATPARELRVALGCNIAVDAGHRTILPGLQLVRAVRRDARSEFDLAYNIPNERAQPLYARVGYQNIGELTRYVRVLRHAEYIERTIKLPWVARPVGAVVDLAQRMRIGRPDRVRGLALEWQSSIDRRFDALWERARGAYSIVSRRDATWLRWRFGSSPVRVIALVERGGATVHAYAVIETIDSVAHVRDLFGPLRDIDRLLGLLAPKLRAAGAAGMSFAYLGSPPLVELLRAHGFQPRDSERRVYVDAGESMSEAERTTALKPGAWHLTEFDEDS